MADPAPTPAASDPERSLSSPSRTAGSPVRLSARRLHRLALHAFRTGNRGRLSLCGALRVLAETRLYLDLGYPSLAAYADAFFQEKYRIVVAFQQFSAQPVLPTHSFQGIVCVAHEVNRFLVELHQEWDRQDQPAARFQQQTDGFQESVSFICVF